MREYDRLIKILSEAMIETGKETLREAEKDLRMVIERVARNNNTTPLLVARGLWFTLKKRGARRTMNGWLGNGEVQPYSPEEYEVIRAMLDKYQKGARKAMKKRKQEGEK